MPNNYVDIAKRLSVPAGKRKQQGRVPKELPDSKIAREIIKRPYHSFSDDRERQLLRHIATQLFHAIRAEGTPETEIQVMHFKGSLFISTNKLATGKKLLDLINKKTLKEILTAIYKPHLNEGKIRSQRYAAKLKQRVFGTEVNIPSSSKKGDLGHAKSVAKIVRNGKCKSLDLGDPDAIAKALAHSDRIIYIITNRLGGKGQNPHAEEFLVDIRNIKDSNRVYSAIAGKKRPCTGCSGRMQGHIRNYSAYPGYFWLDTIKHQSDTTAEKTLAILKEGHTHISVCKNSKSTTTEYDSGSDSECDDELADINSTKVTVDIKPV